ncbi:efflux RND transporter periplasmic adaptor subunit [Novipirellula sp. SH528]|uniref:efflux RND transporter periplasmic adaptor subunit n=1 Tax=Novipirellula sp. SH528 TaxID=3454466 RepID=UPI003F9F52F4
MKHLLSLLFCLPLLAVAGCQTESTPPAGPPAMPVPEVETADATTRKIIDYREYTGRTAAVNSVEIRARVSGYLLQSPRSADSDRTQSNEPADTQAPNSDPTTDETAETDESAKRSIPEVSVNEGELVKKGDLLFMIDPQPYELALQQSKGSLEASEARLKQANKDLTRSDVLLDRNATSAAEYDKAVAAVAELRGQIENLRATVARNQLDLEYTRVRSPIDGLLGRSLVTSGNLVAADTTILTTVVSVDPIYVDFNVDEQSVLDYRTRMLEGEVKDARQSSITIRLGLANEDGFPHEGSINFVNNITDPSSGNTLVRGTFDNDTGILSPGLFARIQAPFTAEYEAVLIPTQAIGMDQQGRYVMVVGDGNKVQRRSIKMGDIVDEMTVIREGIKAGETVVTSGLQKIRPGSEVRLQGAKS